MLWLKSSLVHVMSTQNKACFTYVNTSPVCFHYSFTKNIFMIILGLLFFSKFECFHQTLFNWQLSIVQNTGQWQLHYRLTCTHTHACLRVHRLCNFNTNVGMVMTSICYISYDYIFIARISLNKGQTDQWVRVCNLWLLLLMYGCQHEEWPLIPC